MKIAMTLHQVLWRYFSFFLKKGLMKNEKEKDCYRIGKEQPKKRKGE